MAPPAGAIASRSASGPVTRRILIAALALLALTLPSSGPAAADPEELAASLAKARRWVKKDLRYADAIARLEVILSSPELGPAQRLEAGELLAYAAIALGAPLRAEEAYAAILDHDPDYRPPTGASPKVLEVFARVRARRAKAPPPPPLALARTASAAAPSELIPAVDSRPPTAEAAAESEAWYQKWWLWTIIGAAAVGGASAAIVLSRPGGGPSGTLDPISVP